jgi:hypothetical protein
MVTFLLSKTATGTRLRLIHSGFVTPQNDSAHETLGKGWKVCFERIGVLVSEAGEMQ